MVLAGRGWGKTRTGAEMVRAWAEQGERHIRLVARTPADARDVMIEGESGIMAVSPPWFRPHYERSAKALNWPNGAKALVYSSYEPEALRGPQAAKAWCDEMRAWMYQRETWDNHLFGMRLGENPQTVITTTSSASSLLREIVADPGTVVTRGSTYDNRANLPEEYLRKIIAKYEGTTLGRQELHAELLEEDPRALWTRRMIEDQRAAVLPACEVVVVAIDVATTSGEGSAETGILAAGQLGDQYYPFADESVRARPEVWARRALLLAHRSKADCFVAEANQGGEMIETVLLGAEKDLRASGELPAGPPCRVRLVHATRGKYTRAEPVSALYERKKVHHVGRLVELEDQLCGWVPGEGQPSPDRLDALVWALTYLSESGTLDLATLQLPMEAGRRPSPWRL